MFYIINQQNIVVLKKEGEKMKLNRKKVLIIMAKLETNQRQVADKANISRQSLSAAMNGKSCRPESIGKIANALGCKIEDLIDTE